MTTPNDGGPAFSRKADHDLRGRPYQGAHAERVEKARKMIGAMCSERRPPRMSIPACDLIHSEPCGDEDLYITDLLDDLLEALLAKTKKEAK